MIVGMSIFAALHSEIRHAREQDRPVVHVRVAKDALPGTVAAMPVTPERARALGTLLLLPDETIVGSPVNERLLELLIHPEDWRGLLVEKDALGNYVVDYVVAPGEGGVTRVLGIPVVKT